MKYTKEQILEWAGRGPVSNWKYEDGTPRTEKLFYADWNHKHVEAETQEEADEKLIAYYRRVGICE